MKHFPILFVFALVIECFTHVSAQQIRITPQGDDLFKKIIKGEFVSATDSTITYTDKSGTECVAIPMFVSSVYINGIGTFKNVNGRFLSSSWQTINDVLLAQSKEAEEKRIPEQRIPEKEDDDKQTQEKEQRDFSQTQALVQMQRQIDELMQRQTQAQKQAKKQVFSSFNGTDNAVIGKAFKTTGIVSLSIGVPCLAAGIACCTAGHVRPVETNRYGIPFVSDLTISTRCLEASYYLFGIGASLTIVGIPLYVQGKKIMEMNITYMGNGVGIALNL